MKIIQPGFPAGDGGERLHEPRHPAHDLEHHLADVDVGHHGLTTVPQVGQARGIGDGVDLGGVDPPVGVDIDLHVAEALCEVPQKLVQVAGVLGEEGVRVLG